MSISLAPVTQTLLRDDFSSDPSGPVSSTTWSYPTGPAEYIPSALGPAFPGTETAPFLPDVENGALQLTLQTYNPTSSPPGTSFQGSAIFSNQSFNTNAGGIAFTAVAKLATTVPGMVGGIFAYGLNSPTSHSEIDFESLTDTAAAQNNQEQTNIYSNAPTNTAGNPLLVPDPSLTAYQTYTMEWFPNEVLWFIDGQLVRTETVDVPQGSMQFYLNFWAYDAAPGGILQPTANPQDNTTYTFDVQNITVAAIDNNTLNAATADMILRDGADGKYEIYDIGNNAILGGLPLGPGRNRLAVCRARRLLRQRHHRHAVAQLHDRRLRGLRHQQQQHHQRRLPGHGRLGLAGHGFRQLQRASAKPT